MHPPSACRSGSTALAFALALLLGVASAQTPPSPLPSPTPGAPPPVLTPEEADWKAAMELKQQANVINEPRKGLEAAERFVAFRAKFPKSPHASEALVETGVCWMIAARSQQKWHRNRPEGVAQFKTALEWFGKVATEAPDDPVLPRALYCQGLVHIQLDDVAAAERCFGEVIAKHAKDRLYFGKSLERRGAVRRHRLDLTGARADLALYKREFAAENADPKQQTDEFKTVQRFENYLRVFEQPAPELRAETWPGGEAVALGTLKGEVVALYFFAHWCHNCLNDASFIKEMSERWGPLGVHFVGVTDFSAAPQGSPAGIEPKSPAETQKAVDVVKAYLAQQGFAFPVMMDRGASAQTYMARKYPEIVLIDRQGRVAWHDHAATLMDSTLEALLFGKPEDSKEPPKQGAVAPTKDPLPASSTTTKPAKDTSSSPSTSSLAGKRALQVGLVVLGLGGLIGWIALRKRTA
ncbi:MAG: redoxin family protein [Planctomycetes bacterium]|nr:redoxin family protein [Planctomycetota bacterium]